MGGHDYLAVGIDVAHQLDQAILPLDVKRYLRLIKQEQRGPILHQKESEEQQQNLFLASREVIQRDINITLTEDDTVLIVDVYGLACG